MARKVTSFLDMASLWDLHGFISSSESDELFSELQNVRQNDRDKNIIALVTTIEDISSDEILRVYAAKAHTIRSNIDEEIVERLRYVLLNNRDSLYLRTSVSQALRYINLKSAAFGLIDALLHIQEPELQTIIASAIYNHDSLTWQERAERIIQLLGKDTLHREHLSVMNILLAMLPSGEILKNNRYELTDYLIQKAVVWSNDDRMIGILAGLVIESVGDNLNRANQRARQCPLVEPDDKLRLQPLLAELNSRLTPAELEVRLQDAFQIPLKRANKQIHAIWETSIGSVQKLLTVRLLLGTTLFIAGFLLLMVSVFAYIFVQSNEATVGVLLSLALIVIAVIYSQPLRKTQQMLTDIGVANAVYSSYVQRTLGISHSFAQLYLEGKLDSNEVEKSNKLLSETMNDTVKALRNNRLTSFDDFIDQFSSS